MTAKGALLELKNITKTYFEGDEPLTIVKKLDFTLNAGETVGLVGPSGCGKSTLLNIAGLLDAPTTGDVIVAGQRCNKMTDAAKTRLRGQSMGFVFQFHHLLPEFTVLENVLMPHRIQGSITPAMEKDALELLAEVGLQDRINAFPSTLSGGEKQRAAIIRALIKRPKLLLADEPTGNLDEEKAQQVFALFLKLVKELQCGALIVTHDERLAQKMGTVYRMTKGHLEPCML